MPKSLIVDIANMAFNAIRENKILTKIFEFTVFVQKDKISMIESRTIDSLDNQFCILKTLWKILLFRCYYVMLHIISYQIITTEGIYTK